MRRAATAQLHGSSGLRTGDEEGKVTCKIFENPIWTDVDKADADMFEVAVSSY